MTVKRYSSVTSFDGRSHRMVEFEHGEYVRYADYAVILRSLKSAQEAVEVDFPLTAASIRDAIAKVEGDSGPANGPCDLTGTTLTKQDVDSM